MMARSRTTSALGQFSLCVLMLLLLATSGCDTATPDSQASPVAPPKAVAASVAPVAPQAEEPYVASGQIVVQNQVDILAQREGMVAEILADVDKVVHKGELLARLDDRQLTAQ